ncbi:MAG: hypothetical protein JSU92_14825 [Deltaproteobacteria bacterium]|nr:MAG: hypothetical protein JSU92_14825 [Deltaproteobacteria bacterium]
MKRWFPVILAVMVLFPVSLTAYIIPTHQIVRLMVKGKPEVTAFRIEQLTTFFGDTFTGGKLEVPSLLFLEGPDKARLEISLPQEKRILVSQGKQSVSLAAKRIVPEDKTELRQRLIFRDLILLPSTTAILRLLREEGIDATKVALGRYKGKVSYIIGAREGEENVPQLWIEKERLLPLRFIGRVTIERAIKKIEINYQDYRYLNGGHSYPFQVEFYTDGKLTQCFRAKEIYENPKLVKGMFDIASIKKKYSKVEKPPPKKKPKPAKSKSVK